MGSSCREGATLHTFVERTPIFANQKRLGVVPANAQLTPWPADILKKWDELSPDEKKLFTRQAEVFAGYAAYTDNEIGRIIQEIEDEGKLDVSLPTAPQKMHLSTMNAPIVCLS